MLIKMMEDRETKTHSLKKGEIYRLQSNEASRLIGLKVAKKPTKKEMENLNDNK